MHLLVNPSLALPETHQRPPPRPHRHAKRNEVPRVDYDKLSSDRLGEPSAKIRERVEKARERQRKRLAGTKLQCNGDMGPAEVRAYCVLDETGKSLLRAAMQQMSQIPRPERSRRIRGADERAGCRGVL